MSASFPSSPPTPGEPPEHFGRYRILRHLARGGMGSVYLALDTHLDRQVALKVPVFLAGEGAETLDRFYREARLAATLHHANICPVYDVGQIDGIHYLTMAYLSGRTLAQALQDRPLFPQREAASLVRVLALALAEAHGLGVIHRDLKPSNVMLSVHDRPVVMDFGLARNVNQVSTRLTRSGAVLGTPAYMAPEQVRGEVQNIGPRCDIYSLGVILYEVLTGRLPFEGPTGAVLGKILTEDAPAPSAYRPDLSPRLEAVCRKAMARQAGDRYPTMADFATALDAYLQEEGPAASAPGATVRGGVTQPSAEGGPSQTPRTPRTPVRTRRPLKWVAGGTLVVALAGAVGLIPLLRRPPPAPAAPPTPGTLQLTLRPPELEVEVAVDGNLIDRAQLLNPISLPVGKHQVRVSGGGYESKTQEVVIQEGPNPALTIQLRREGEKVIEVGRFACHAEEVTALAVSPDGKTFLTGSADCTARLWDVATGKPIGPVLEHADRVASVAFSPDGKTVATLTASGIGQLWQAATGQPVGRSLEEARDVVISTSGGYPLGSRKRLANGVSFITFSTDGAAVMVVSEHLYRGAGWNEGKNLHYTLWDVTKPISKALSDRDVTLSDEEHKSNTDWSDKCRYLVAVSSDARTAVASNLRRTALQLYGVRKGDQLGEEFGQKDRINAAPINVVVFSPDGKIVATGSDDQTACLWEAATGKPIGDPLKHEGRVNAVAFSPDGLTLATGGDDQAVRLWKTATGELVGSPLQHGATIDGVAFSPDGKTLLTRSGNRIWLWALNAGTPVALYQRRTAVKAAAFAPDGKSFFTGSREGVVRVWTVPG